MTWRDPVVLGLFPVGGVLAIGIVVGAAIVLVGTTLWSGRRMRARAAGADGEDGPSWPDPETRAQF